jgi:uncharacterized membrane protein
MTDEELLRIITALHERISRLEEAAGFRQQQAVISQPKTPSATQDELETRIGAHWLNRVGIIAVLIGVSYFLKYAFDNEWVGPAARVVIGLAAGLGVVFWSEYVRRSGYAVFSYSLKAVGIGVLYLSLWASSQLYQLIPTGLAFIAMVGVTAATVALAIWQDAEVIAAFAAIGAFLTPVALSTGQNNAISLFTYVTILDIGALVLTRYRPWIRVLLGSFLGTLILYSVWHSRFYTVDQFSIAMAAAFAAFIVFAVTPFLDRHERDAHGILLLSLANAAVYFFEVWELFNHAGESRQAATAAIVFGCIYFLIAYQLTGRAPAATSQVHWTIGAALLIVAVPLGLDTPWITIGWFVEAAALIGVSRRTGNEYVKYLGAIALVLGIGRLLAIDNFDVSLLLLNERLLTFAVAIASLVYVAMVEEDQRILAFLSVAINVLALVALTREVTDAFSGIARNFAYSALWMSYGAGLMFVGFWKKTRFLRWQALILIAVTVGKVFLYDTSSLDRGYRILSLIALGLVLLVTSFLYQRVIREQT